MSKQKTRSAVKKRFRKTGGKSVKIKRAQGFRRHLLTKKTTKKKRQLRQTAYVADVDFDRIIKLLP